MCSSDNDVHAFIDEVHRRSASRSKGMVPGIYIIMDLSPFTENHLITPATPYNHIAAFRIGSVDIEDLYCILMPCL